MKHKKIIFTIAGILLGVAIFFLCITFPRDQESKIAGVGTRSRETGLALPRPAVSLEEANTYKCTKIDGRLVESGVARHPMRPNRIPPGYREFDLDTNTYRLLIVESGLEYLVASRTFGKGGAAEGIGPTFRFCDHYVMDNCVYYIYRTPLRYI
ncbi:hypothetical protein [Ereboglobus luteus]|uniref:hypothetical protein n=1 Tax=Ereboglobus luteus TaxID=1796921 RepID=UPI0012602982|nr:hypothetical protein [Ereboglobus luteus]